jgi:glycolate oxidase iron-sulfur subunit
MLNTQQLIAEADRCVACGLCLPQCPTYYKTGSEADSPRGRIQLISAVAREILPANARYQQHMDLCLGCRNCETACPNGVQYGALIDTARANIAALNGTAGNKATRKYLKSNIALKLLNYMLYNPIYMRLAGQLIWVLQKTRLIHIANFMPRLAKPVALLPAMPKPQTWRALYPTSKQKKAEVSLFLGCISNTFDTDTLRASVFVLNQLGIDVHIPSDQACCGGLARQQGNATLANEFIVTNNHAFNKSMPVLTVASGCGAGLHDYADLNTLDISAYLANCDWHGIELKALNEPIIVHEPCTLRNVQKSHLAVVDLLKKIPLTKITNLSGNAQCCGGAGAYMLNQSDMAATLLQDKVLAVKKTSSSILATSNIGCALHIASGLRAQSMTVNVLHPVKIIAKQMGFNGKLD